ncbi:hypothetical protein Acr_24g0006010 [Actinidia rufa]|uniref:Uncharacterized protein n=1 Tax=Actinidia rufa TaxID=165716 RepID=A0A7J0GUJ9_9ERIC|nr:hypothetical protein Acr_24g0006010 [Actinidia rufa]
MLSHSSNRSNSRETHKETPYAPKTPGHRGGKLLEDAQKTVGATSRQNPSRLLLRGEDSRDVIIEHLQRQLIKLTQIMVDSKLMRPVEAAAPRQTEGQIKELTLPPREGFPSSLGDLELKWFDKLPARSIKNFHQLTESFVPQFVINIKAPKGAKKATGIPSQGEGPFKKQKENTVDYGVQARKRPKQKRPRLERTQGLTEAMTRQSRPRMKKRISPWAIKFATLQGKEPLYGDQVAAKQCYLATVSNKAATKEVQLIEQEKEVLEDVRRGSRGEGHGRERTEL